MTRSEQNGNHAGSAAGSATGGSANENRQSVELGLFKRAEGALARAPSSIILLVYAALVIALEFYGPWWCFVLPTSVLGFVTGAALQHSHRACKIQGRAVAGCATLTWVLMSVIRDYETHWRISPRL